MPLERQVVKPLQPQYTEYNVTTLGLIPLQVRVPEAVLHGWSTQPDPMSPETGQGIKCETTDNAVIPHGLANDVFASLVTTSVGARENGEQTLKLTPTAIARQCGLTMSGRVEASIAEAIHSLANTQFTLWNNWFSVSREVSRRTQLRIIDQVDIQHEDHPFDNSKRKTVYGIRLNPHIIESIDGALTMVTSREILKALHSPTARGLYRLLEGWRRDPRDFSLVKPSITISAFELIESGRILGSRREPAFLLRKILDSTGPFAQLKEAGYLQNYETVGRAWDMTLKVTFAQSAMLVNTIAMKLLTDFGIKYTTAEQLSTTHTTEEVECALWIVQEKVKRDPKIRNPCGLLITTIKEPNFSDELEKYRQRHRSSMSKNQVVKKTSRTADMLKEKELEEDLEIDKDGFSDLHRTLNSICKIKFISSEQASHIHQLIDESKLTSIDIQKLIRSSVKEVREIIEDWFLSFVVATS